jgi:hypothetical protein
VWIQDGGEWREQRRGQKQNKHIFMAKTINKSRTQISVWQKQYTKAEQTYLYGKNNTRTNLADLG